MTDRLYDFVTGQARWRKASVVLASDALVIVAASYAAVALRISEPDIGLFMRGWVLSLAYLLPLGAGLSIVLSIPWMSTRAFDSHGMSRLLAFCVVLGAVYFAINGFFFFSVPRSAPLIFVPLCLVMMAATRSLMRVWLRGHEAGDSGGERVLIYGAGDAGLQLANALRQYSGARAVAFIDDNPQVQRVLIGRLRVHSPNDIDRLISSRGVTQIVLAMPSVPQTRKRQILQSLQRYPVVLRTLPHFADFMVSTPLIEQVREVVPEDVLGRQPRSLDMPEVAQSYAGKIVLVTGAGGSIGSELVMQLASVPVGKLVLYDHSEAALYSVERRLRDAEVECEIVAVLGSVLQSDLLEQSLHAHDVEVVFHAAAYKHVPLVEHNEIAGAKNNVMGTVETARVCGEAGVKRFILISSDKAVRPTNVMGATKRLAELGVQHVQTLYPHTLYSAVRFGNVIGSSGSVVPLFREQIAKGGPVTVTHPEVTRYFMTIGEAAQLVLLAGTFAKGGEIFLLDMGEPVRILDMVRNMLAVSGLTERTSDNPDGDIEIDFIGLRPGEKLYEELLLGEKHAATPHPKILCADERDARGDAFAVSYASLKRAIDANDPDALRGVFQRVVDGYVNSCPPAEERASA